jgi:hydrogenase expression/formation protein HypC
MCLGIPGEILQIDESGGARVSIGGAMREVCLALVPEAAVGDYVLVHAGYAIQVMDAEAAEETLELLREAFSVAERVET